ncbi:MAG: hypothetical protein MZW92_35385 [Comamonadaceae bacterium]|nr:hypothetical protein [Comamonadaceae bacterium]
MRFADTDTQLKAQATRSQQALNPARGPDLRRRAEPAVALAALAARASARCRCTSASTCAAACTSCCRST